MKVWGVRAAWAGLGLVLVMIGVNIAPTIHAWQGHGYDYDHRPPVLPPIAPIPDAELSTKFIALEARLRDLEARPGPDLASLERKLERIDNKPVLAPDNRELLAALAKMEQRYEEARKDSEDIREKLATLEVRSALAEELPGRPAAVPAAIPAVRPGGKVRPPKVLTNQQLGWAQSHPDHTRLRLLGVSDLEIVRRYGNEAVWSLPELPMGCRPGDPNCQVK